MCFPDGSPLLRFVDNFENESGLCAMFFGVFLKFFLSYDRRSKFDSVLHTENGDVLYRIPAIHVDCRCQDHTGLSSHPWKRCQTQFEFSVIHDHLGLFSFHKMFTFFANFACVYR